ncbi:MAG: hypothetical protein NTV33_11415 [Coprothermobacterota bacterium]|nr:hypothetical protein [Coprothermobacterota bacterium]
MPVEVSSVQCGDCGEELPENPSLPITERTPCPMCGSLGRTTKVSFHETSATKSKLGAKGRHVCGGKPFVEEVSGDDLHMENCRWMKLTRVIDREKNLYQESVVDPTTGEVVHECKEPLSKHQNHGNAKKRLKEKDAGG